MSTALLIAYFAVGYAIGIWTFWPYRAHSLMTGIGFPAIATLLAAVWPMWLLVKAWEWIISTLERRRDE